MRAQVRLGGVRRYNQIMNIDILFRGSGLLLGLVGLWLIYWFLLADRAKGRKRCPKCWYDMPSADSLRCSECGNEAKREADLLKTRRRWNGLWLCVLVFLAAGYLWIQPKVKQDGWVSVLPNTALILCLKLENNQAFFAELDRRTQTDVSNLYPDSDSTGLLVTDSESLYQWQWRFIGNICIDLMKDDSDVLDRQMLYAWFYFASISVPVEDAHRIFRATIPLLADDDPRIRGLAVIYCADSRFSEEAVEAISPLFDDPIQQVRLSAVNGLGTIGMHNSAPLPILVDALNHEDAQVRAGAAAHLGVIANTGEEPKLAFETLVNVYETDSDVEVRAEALGAIWEFKSHRKRAIEYLREAFSSTESVMREKAMYLLSIMDQFDEAFDLEFALKGLTDESAGVRSGAAWILQSRISTDSLRPHVEFLRELLDSGDEELQGMMWLLLKRIQDATDD